MSNADLPFTALLRARFDSLAGFSACFGLTFFPLLQFYLFGSIAGLHSGDTSWLGLLALAMGIMCIVSIHGVFSTYAALLRLASPSRWGGRGLVPLDAGYAKARHWLIVAQGVSSGMAIAILLDGIRFSDAGPGTMGVHFADEMPIWLVPILCVLAVGAAYGLYFSRNSLRE